MSYYVEIHDDRRILVSQKVETQIDAVSLIAETACEGCRTARERDQQFLAMTMPKAIEALGFAAWDIGQYHVTVDPVS